MHLVSSFKQRPNRVLQILLAVSIVGFAHWFFGNLYEAFVLTPNLLGLGAEGLQLWRQFFKFSDPIYYFLPWNPLSILIVFAALIVGRQSPTKQRKWLIQAAFFALCTGLLTAYIITQFNLKLYFGPLSQDKVWLESQQRLSALFSLFRLGCEVATLYFTLRAYLFSLRLSL